MISKGDILIRLREAILESDLTINEIADRLKIDGKIISEYFEKDILPSPEIFANLCKILGVSADYICCLK